MVAASGDHSDPGCGRMRMSGSRNSLLVGAAIDSCPVSMFDHWRFCVGVWSRDIRAGNTSRSVLSLNIFRLHGRPPKSLLRW